MELKKRLSEQERMDTTVDQYKAILAREMRGPGDMEAAMYRLQSKRGLDYWKQWMLKYKRAAGKDFVEQIRQAYLDTLAASVRRDLEALRIEQAKGAADAGLENLISEAEALLAKIEAKKVTEAA
jgi:hypothetical protein